MNEESLSLKRWLRKAQGFIGIFPRKGYTPQSPIVVKPEELSGLNLKHLLQLVKNPIQFRFYSVFKRIESQALGAGSSHNKTNTQPAIKLEALYSTLKQRYKDRNFSMENLDFSGFNFEGVDLEGLNLSGANFSGTNLRQANLHRANLCQAQLEGAQLEDVKVQGVICDSANYQKHIAPLLNQQVKKTQSSTAVIIPPTTAVMIPLGTSQPNQYGNFINQKKKTPLNRETSQPSFSSWLQKIKFRLSKICNGVFHFN